MGDIDPNEAPALAFVLSLGHPEEQANWRRAAMHYYERCELDIGGNIPRQLATFARKELEGLGYRLVQKGSGD